MDRFNLLKQLNAIFQMTPQQAQDYRQQVNTVLPKIPVQPSATLPTPTPGSGYERMLSTLVPAQPWAVKTANTLVNPLQTGAEGLARLPAARNMGEGIVDIADILGGILQGASLLHAGKAGALVARDAFNRVGEKGSVQMGSPAWQNEYLKTLRQVKQAQGGVKNNIERTNDTVSGWSQGGREKFDNALISNDTQALKSLLPKTPENYLTRGFGEQAYKALLFKHNPNQYFKIFAPKPSSEAFNPANMPDPSTRILTDQIVKPNVLKQAVNWFYK